MTNRDMMQKTRRAGRPTGLALAAAAALSAAACGATDKLLEANDPDLVSPGDVRSAEGADGLRNGALYRLRRMTAGGPAAGEEGNWLFGGLLADEWTSTSTFTQNDEADARNVQDNNSTNTANYRNIMRTRTAANQAIAALREYRPTQTAEIAEMYFARGFAELQTAQDYCNGIVFSDAASDELVLGTPITVQQAFEVALASFDSAAAIATGTDAASVSVRNAARVGRARALAGLGKPAEAAAAVSGIATGFAYNVTFATTSGDNTLWGQNASGLRYSVGDSVEGNARNITVRNAVPFTSARDPRVPADYRVTVSATRRDTTRGQDGKYYVRVTTLFGRETPVALVNGTDARLVEAEARLAAGDAAGMLATLNALRASATGLAPLADPGTKAGREDLLFREKAFWTFGRGQRLGDLRRLVRQYGRTAESVFPVGEYFKGGTYGADVNLPIPQQEVNNPNFKGCLDRRA